MAPNVVTSRPSTAKCDSANTPSRGRRRCRLRGGGGLQLTGAHCGQRTAHELGNRHVDADLLGHANPHRDPWAGGRRPHTPSAPETGHDPGAPCGASDSCAAHRSTSPAGRAGAAEGSCPGACEDQSPRSERALRELRSGAGRRGGAPPARASRLQHRARSRWRRCRLRDLERGRDPALSSARGRGSSRARAFPGTRRGPRRPRRSCTPAASPRPRTAAGRRARRRAG